LVVHRGTLHRTNGNLQNIEGSNPQTTTWDALGGAEKLDTESREKIEYWG